MSKVSIAKAAKIFAVSRPSLLDHIRKGKISAEKDGEQWQIDMAELNRVYQRRDGKGDNTRHGGLPAPDTTPDMALQSEIKVLQAKLEAAEILAEERARHIEDLRALLPAPRKRRFFLF
jgi:excisionase family DNA binding protein